MTNSKTKTRRRTMMTMTDPEGSTQKHERVSNFMEEDQHCLHDDEEEECPLVPQQQHSAAVSIAEDVNAGSNNNTAHQILDHPTTKTTASTTSLTAGAAAAVVAVPRSVTGPSSYYSAQQGGHRSGLLLKLGLLSLALIVCIAATVFGLREADREPRTEQHLLELDESAGRDSIKEGRDDDGKNGGARERCRRPKGASRLRRLVRDCARQLDLPGGHCSGAGGSEATTAAAAVEGNSYRVPFMDTGDLPCGFEVGWVSSRGYFFAFSYHTTFETDYHVIPSNLSQK